MKNMGTLASRLRAFKLQITATAAMALLAGQVMAQDAQVMAQDAQVWKLQATDAQQKQAAEAGAADGKSKGTATLPTEKKIGVVLLSGQSASSNRILEPVKALAELLKFEVITCDPNFDAQKVAQCATSMVAQSASAIFTISTSPGPMGSALRDAKDTGIPVIGMVSSVQPTPLIIQYGSPGVASAQLSAKWLFDNAKQRKGPDAKLKFMLLTAPTVGLANLIEEQEVIKAAAANPNVEIVIKHDLDLGNIVQDTIAMSKQAVQQHPDLAGIWTVCDLCIPLISQALDGEGVTGDKRPIIVGDYTTAQTVDLIRKGKVDGVMDLPLEASVWVGFDQLLSFWSKETPINTSYDVFEKGYGLKFMEPYILTKANIGASGPIPVISSDYESYFRAKWKAEYGL